MALEQDRARKRVSTSPLSRAALPVMGADRDDAARVTRRRQRGGGGTAEHGTAMGHGKVVGLGRRERRVRGPVGWTRGPGVCRSVRPSLCRIVPCPCSLAGQPAVRGRHHPSSPAITLSFRPLRFPRPETSAAYTHREQRPAAMDRAEYSTTRSRDQNRAREARR